MSEHPDVPDERRLSLLERLARVYERLDELPPVRQADEAFKQLTTTLDQVEDEHSGVPRNPNPGLKFDGRMDLPRADFTEHTEDGGLKATARGNLIHISPDGTLSILSRKSGAEVYRGADLGELNSLDLELRKVQSLAATEYPPPRQPLSERKRHRRPSGGSLSATTAHWASDFAKVK